MDSHDYPSLYQSADAHSASMQKQYLNILAAQYTLLFIAAIAALTFDVLGLASLIYCLCVILSTFALMYGAFLKPEKDWYSARALAESLKTSTWRFMMNAEPFAASLTRDQARAEFVKFIQDITNANSSARDAVKRKPVKADQVTASMERVRALPLTDRKAFYLQNRINNQAEWYRSKADQNRMKFRLFIALVVLIQGAAIVLSICHYKNPSAMRFWPTEPLLVLASSFIGWIQIKKFNELAAAYNLTAYEINLLLSKAPVVPNEQDWSDFVNESELAFSREHTQWVARQDAAG